MTDNYYSTSDSDDRLACIDGITKKPCYCDSGIYSNDVIVPVTLQPVIGGKPQIQALTKDI